jgi:tetratricopeptide (TPR) repeat protein
MPLTLIERAYKFYEKGNIKKTQDCCNDAIKRGQQVDEAYNALGAIAHKAGRIGEAHHFFSQAVAANPDYFPSYANLGLLCRLNGDYAQAKKYYTRVLLLSPKNAESHFGLGYALNELNQVDKALVHYQLAVGYNPAHAPAYNNMANIFNNRRQWPEAVYCYQKCLEYQPKSLEAHHNLCKVILTCDGQNEWKKRLINSTNIRSTEFIPKDSSVFINLAIMCWIDGEYDKIPSLLDKVNCLLKLHSKSKLYQQQHPKDYNYASVYNNLLKKLLQWRTGHLEHFTPENINTATIHIIGESHALTLAKQSLTVINKAFRTEIWFIPGIKLWHITNDDTGNKYNTRFKKNLNELPKDALLLITVGEIDCRSNDGIFKAYLKKKIDWKENINTMIPRYFDRVILPLKQQGKTPMVWGAPSPSKKKIERTLATNHHAQYCQCVLYFNEVLDEHCRKHAIPFIDNYRHTLGENGYADDSKKIDTIHLTPDSFIEALTETMAKHQQREAQAV